MKDKILNKKVSGWLNINAVDKEKIYSVSLESLKTKNIKLIEKRLENSLELIK